MGILSINGALVSLCDFIRHRPRYITFFDFWLVPLAEEFQEIEQSVDPSGIYNGFEVLIPYFRVSNLLGYSLKDDGRVIRSTHLEKCGRCLNDVQKNLKERRLYVEEDVVREALSEAFE